MRNLLRGRCWDKQIVDGHFGGLAGRNASAEILFAHLDQLDE